MTGRLVAVTGASGFLGQRLLAALVAAGWGVRALIRPSSSIDAAYAPGVETTIGDVADYSSLERLVEGADAVIHAAGLIKARNRREFFEVNEGGASRVAQVTGSRRLILISSLAAREPSLSDYAASKRAGEDAARRLRPEGLTIVRPPAIYGPGDRETLTLFKAASGLIMVTPHNPGARIAVAEVDDVVSVLVDLLRNEVPSSVTIGGDRPEGYGWAELTNAAAKAVGGRPVRAEIPAWGVLAASHLSSYACWVGRQRSIFTPGKVREMLHPDWSVSEEEMGPISSRRFKRLDDGFARTVAWYRRQGWLSGMQPD